MMDIVFCTDNNYVMPCGISMVSLFENNDGQDITVHIIGMNLSKSSENILKGISDKYNSSVIFYNIDEEYIKKFELSMSGPKHVRISTYIRLFSAEILPQSLHKILYLDCDLIITDNLTQLWETDISDISVVGVIDAPNFRPDTYLRLNYDNRYPYINAGVLLINLKYWRENNIQDKLLEYAKSNYPNIQCHDQDVINGALHESIKLLPLRYNMHNFFYLEKWNAHEYQNEMIDSRATPAIVHFSTGNKPWVKGSFHPLTQLYLKYKDISPWKSEPISWTGVSFNKRIKYYKRIILYALRLKRTKYVKAVNH